MSLRACAADRAAAVERLDTFTRSYVTTALWLLDEDPGSGEWSEHDEYCAENVRPDTLARMAADCRRFQEENATDVAECGLRIARAGQDFWLNRNGHGSGFWDEGEEECFARLDRASHAFGEFALFVGDDGMISGM